MTRPGDLSLIAYDDGEVARARDLSVVAQPVETMGAVAAELMLQVMDHGAEGVSSVFVPTVVVVRSSS